MVRHTRVKLADVSAQIESMFTEAYNKPEELLELSNALNTDRLNYLDQKKMGRVRIVNNWSDRIFDRLSSLKEAEFQAIPTLGIF
jgi:hypothetical protein